MTGRAQRWWDDLGDDELLRRLAQRGIPVDDARVLVNRREHVSYVRWVIDQYLGTE